DESRDEDEIERPVAGDLVGDVNVAAPRVARLGSIHGSETVCRGAGGVKNATSTVYSNTRLSALATTRSPAARRACGVGAAARAAYVLDQRRVLLAHDRLQASTNLARERGGAASGGDGDLQLAAAQDRSVDEITARRAIHRIDERSVPPRGHGDGVVHRRDAG